jgi:hypothetical protein
VLSCIVSVGLGGGAALLRRVEGMLAVPSAMSGAVQVQYGHTLIMNTNEAITEGFEALAVALFR